MKSLLIAALAATGRPGRLPGGHRTCGPRPRSARKRVAGHLTSPPRLPAARRPWDGLSGNFAYRPSHERHTQPVQFVDSQVVNASSADENFWLPRMACACGSLSMQTSR